MKTVCCFGVALNEMGFLFLQGLKHLLLNQSIRDQLQSVHFLNIKISEVLVFADIFFSRVKYTVISVLLPS